VNKFLFWQRWLFVVALVIVIFGLFMAFFNQTPWFDFLFNRQINPVFWNSPTVTSEIRIFQGWIYGVLGSTVAGWGVFLAFLVYFPFKKRENWSWYCIACGLTLWFLSDTTISLFYGVYFNGLFNLILYVAGILPLGVCRKEFDLARRVE
jgi:hypothetical protein